MSMMTPQYFPMTMPAYYPAVTPIAYPQSNPYTPGIPNAEIGPILPSRLMNGATGYFQQAPQQQQTAINVFLPIGPSLSGIRALLPQLLLEGSESTKAMVTACSARGINIGAAPMGDKLMISATGPTGSESDLMQTVMQLMTRPIVDSATFNRIKEDTLKNIQQAQSEPTLAVSEAVTKQLYGASHPYAKSSNELIAEVSQLSLGQVMASYQQALQLTGQSKVMVVSPQALESQQMLLNQGVQQFGWYQNPYQPARPLPSTPPVAAWKGKRGPILVPNESIPRAEIITAWRAPKVNDPDYPAFSLMFEILRGMNTGFFKVLRTEQGLVYGTHQAYNQEKHAADYSVNAQVDFDKIGQGLRGIQQVVDGMMRNFVTAGELSMAKKRFILGLRQSMQTAEGIGGQGVQWLQSDMQPLHPDALKAAIERVTPQDIQRVANRYLNPASGYQVIGVSAPSAVLRQWFSPRGQSTTR